ncbi:uncharacterized protein EDB93DRAFT_1329723 [Suillus bovinus]|uniref:uncharacterized protein n=1 Tax=Suillus bovinus TaxID=48563 RepID=UPI001B87B097|nr:uncharacterized protein EDB93DRAFT_1329723 [Suillus bovinus]KAG2142245.1 hypothetical protein EDB93DRAFT_1329723 [Suillus bovinus]
MSFQQLHRLYLLQLLKLLHSPTPGFLLARPCQQQKSFLNANLLLKSQKTSRPGCAATAAYDLIPISHIFFALLRFISAPTVISAICTTF